MAATVPAKGVRKAPPAAAIVKEVPITAASSPTVAIDQLVAKQWRLAKVQPVGLVDDRAFARRVYLDLAGRIPTLAEADAFVLDRAPAKRAALVDRLLASPDFGEQMRDVFDVAFMGRANAGGGGRRRRGNPPAGLRQEWLSFLERGFSENRPWDRTLREMVLARPEVPADRGAIWFLYSRGDRYQEVAESVSASMLGVKVDCAQCHNHFSVTEIKQKDYWGLVAFFNRSKPQETKNGPRVAESAIGGFASFASLQGEKFPAELTLFGAAVPEMRPDPNTMEKDAPELYQPLPPSSPSDEPRTPLFSRRQHFADKVLKDNPRVARSAVNRFWALLMGRGLVHPVDKMDSRHDPSHPQLLDWLASDFQRSGYDVKRLVRAMVLSRPYQLQAVAPTVPRPELFAYGLEKPLTGEQFYRSVMVATEGPEAENGELARRLVEVFPDVFPEENVSTLRQAMFLTNGPMIEKLVEPKAGSTVTRLAAIRDEKARVTEAFRIAYGRDPDAEEVSAFVGYFRARSGQVEKATARMWWSLISSAEFRYNH